MNVNGMIQKSDIIDLVDDTVREIEELRDGYRKMPHKASIVDSMYRKGMAEGAKEALRRVESLRKTVEVY